MVAHVCLFIEALLAVGHVREEKGQQLNIHEADSPRSKRARAQRHRDANRQTDIQTDR